jgi:hypothetical protein
MIGTKKSIVVYTVDCTMEKIVVVVDTEDKTGTLYSPW